MNAPAMQAQIDAATVYEAFLVPALFQEWAPRVVAAAQLQPGHRVLDVACGTGVLAREAALCVGSTGSVAGLDANPGYWQWPRGSGLESSGAKEPQNRYPTRISPATPSSASLA